MTDMSEIKNLNWLELKTCKNCGKRFSVLYPDLWAYKEGNNAHRIWYCSWKCLRAARGGDERKGDIIPMGKGKGRNRLELARELVGLMDAGKDPIEYLDGLGYASPSQAYQDIRNYVKEKDPELFARFPVRRKTGPKPKEKPVSAAEAMQAMNDAADEFFGKCEDMGLQINSAEPVRIQPEEEADPWAVTAIRHPDLGEFYRDVKYNTIDWRTIGGDEVGMDLPGWTDLAEELPKILKKLGVDV